MVKVDKPAINNFFVTNQWKFLLIGEKGEKAEGKYGEGSGEGLTTVFIFLFSSRLAEDFQFLHAQ